MSNTFTSIGAVMGYGIAGVVLSRGTVGHYIFGGVLLIFIAIAFMAREKNGYSSY